MSDVLTDAELLELERCATCIRRPHERYRIPDLYEAGAEWRLIKAAPRLLAEVRRLRVELAQARTSAFAEAIGACESTKLGDHDASWQEAATCCREMIEMRAGLRDPETGVELERARGMK